MKRNTNKSVVKVKPQLASIRKKSVRKNTVNKEKVKKYTDVYMYFKGSKSLQQSLYMYVTDELKRGNSEILPSKPNLQPEVNNCIAKHTGLSKPTMSQYLFHVIARAIASKHVDLKGLICWFSTGAGKTIVAAGIYDAFHTDYKVYYISRHDSLKPPEEVHRYMLPIWKTRVSVKDFKKGFEVMSIATFSNKVKKGMIDLNKSCVVVDEAQYLFANRAVPQLKKLHTELIQRLKATKDAKVFILTATPGDSMSEFTTLLNIVKHPKENHITEQNYKDHVEDKVLFVNMYRDRSMYPDIQGNYGGKMIHVTMDKPQEEAYTKKLKETKNQKTHQKWSNHLYTYTNTYSPKVERIVKEIMKHPNDKHYVYSQYFKQGLQDLMKKLLSMGYSRVTDATKNKRKKQFILAKASERFVASDDNNSLLRAFNSEENKNGDRIRIFLATDSYNAGLDLKAVKHIHFMEPTKSFLDTVQGVGRGARLCSHKHLDKEHWKVHVYTYFSNPTDQNTISVDQNIFTNASTQYYKYDNDMHKLRTNAIDCKVMSKFHNQGITPDVYGYIKCSQGNGDPYNEDPTNVLKYERNVQKGINKIRKVKELQKERYKRALEFKNILVEQKRKEDILNKAKRVMEMQKKRYKDAAKKAKLYAGKKREINRKKSNEIKKKWKRAAKKVKQMVKVLKELKRKKRILDRKRELERLQKEEEERERKKKEQIRKEQLEIIARLKEKSLKRKEIAELQKKHNAERKKQLQNIKKRAGPRVNIGKRKVHLVF